MPVYAPLDVHFVRGAGCVLVDTDGTEYLDALSGIAVCGLGHCHPDVTAALQAQAGTLVHTSNLYTVDQQQELAATLCAAAGMAQAFFGNSGAEACECALKIARAYGHAQGKELPRILVAERAFHGRSLFALSASDGAKLHDGFAPLAAGFVRVPFNDLDAVRDAFAAEPDLCAVFVEPIQGEGGVRVADHDYLRGLRTLCDTHDALLMLDEIQSGMGRTGTLFAYQAADVAPDVVTVAKALGNGYPIGACLAAGRAENVLGFAQHGSTFGGSPLACTVARTVLDVIARDDLATRAATAGALLQDALKTRLLGKYGVREVRGVGLMIGLALDADAPELAAKALTEQHLLINVTRGNVIRLLPPLVLSDNQALDIAIRLEAALAA